MIRRALLLGSLVCFAACGDQPAASVTPPRARHIADETYTNFVWDYASVLGRNVLVYADTDTGAWFAEVGMGSTVDTQISFAPGFEQNADTTWSLNYYGYVWSTGSYTEDDWVAAYGLAETLLAGGPIEPGDAPPPAMDGGSAPPLDPPQDSGAGDASAGDAGAFDVGAGDAGASDASFNPDVGLTAADPTPPPANPAVKPAWFWAFGGAAAPAPAPLGADLPPAIRDRLYPPLPSSGSTPPPSGGTTGGGGGGGGGTTPGGNPPAGSNLATQIFIAYAAYQLGVRAIDAAAGPPPPPTVSLRTPQISSGTTIRTGTRFTNEQMQLVMAARQRNQAPYRGPGNRDQWTPVGAVQQLDPATGNYVAVQGQAQGVQIPRP